MESVREPERLSKLPARPSVLERRAADRDVGHVGGQAIAHDDVMRSAARRRDDQLVLHLRARQDGRRECALQQREHRRRLRASAARAAPRGPPAERRALPAEPPAAPEASRAGAGGGRRRGWRRRRGRGRRRGRRRRGQRGLLAVQLDGLDTLPPLQVAPGGRPCREDGPRVRRDHVGLDQERLATTPLTVSVETQVHVEVRVVREDNTGGVALDRSGVGRGHARQESKSAINAMTDIARRLVVNMSNTPP